MGWTLGRFGHSPDVQRLRGRERAFAVTVNKPTAASSFGSVNDQRFENGDNRVQWKVETPAWTWGASLT
jgi:hypothetical protein